MNMIMDINDPNFRFGFDRAIKYLKAGKNVAREGWQGYWFITEVSFEHKGEMCHEPIILAALKDGGYATAQAYQSDMFAEDWKIVLEDSWEKAIAHAECSLNKHRKERNNHYAVNAINQLIERYKKGERTEELLEELEGLN